MTHSRIEEILQRIREGSLSPREALGSLREVLVQDLEYAQVDNARPLTQGAPEIVYGEGKTPEQITGICAALLAGHGSFLVTRADAKSLAAIRRRFPAVEVNEIARTALLSPADLLPPPVCRGTVLIVTAGTSDLPVAEEAAVVGAALGNTIERLADVGVAGIHRVLRSVDRLKRASVIIVVAGMDGALASVVGGMVSCPVVAVPTSVGYGTAFQGVAPLLAMLNSCAGGVTVVNIDSGFGAAVAATRINRME